ncbi:MAG: ATPase domain-containing protein, partial [Nitrososphaerales archaeon]
MQEPMYVQTELDDVKKVDTLPRPGNALLENLLNEGIRFILLKGEPGTGKTTLALDLLKKHGKGAYVTTRVSLEQLQTHKPELRNLLLRNDVLTKEGAGHKDLSFEDLRLSAVEDILQEIIEASDKMGPESLIVLDSWDALAKKLDMTERMKVEQSLLAIAEASKAKILFVSEEIALGTSDYFVDAVVQLEDDVHHGHRLRRLVWKKLRGSEISQRSFLYTLKGGKFTILENTKVLWPEEYQSGTFKPIKHGSIRYSTGSEDVDRFLGGGFRRGSSILLELDKQIGSNWHAPLVQSIERNFLGNGCATMIIPT